MEINGIEFLDVQSDITKDISDLELGNAKKYKENIQNYFLTHRECPGRSGDIHLSPAWPSDI